MWNVHKAHRNMLTPVITSVVVHAPVVSVGHMQINTKNRLFLFVAD